jgi:hypothetical protein
MTFKIAFTSLKKRCCAAHIPMSILNTSAPLLASSLTSTETPAREEHERTTV